MVDKVNNEPLSLAKAKRDGIKMAKLPLDRFEGSAMSANGTTGGGGVIGRDGEYASSWKQ
ncbi:hypothetical protein MSG28_007414 [Choristoneura fumiferana]|uniref:Uncharacterized protein n=1 Tax=Choristoneura fumiferana TaxID=7141 RepID=A0ACC0JXE8_CHOFU|nr:hypothetical protein MSG28_007414 [Choristoneura fumiferana]